MRSMSSGKNFFGYHAEHQNVTKCIPASKFLQFDMRYFFSSFTSCLAFLSGIYIRVGPNETRDARAQLARYPRGVERTLHRQQRSARQHRDRPRDGDAQGEMPLRAQGRRGCQMAISRFLDRTCLALRA